MTVSRIAVVLALGVAMPAWGTDAPALQSRVEAVFDAAPKGTRFGLVVTDDTGRVLVAVHPDERFIPASNTKVFTTSTGFWALKGIDAPDPAGGTGVRLAPRDGRAPDVVLEGRGDAVLSSAPDCEMDCLATLADAVAAKTRVVGDVVGDDSWYPDERWSPGMSWNNIQTESGTGISALTLDDNELPLSVAPGASGAPPVVTTPGYYRVENAAITVAAGPTALSYDRVPNSDTIWLRGTIAIGAKPARFKLGIDDPAHYAAWMLRNMLVARGVRVAGVATARHRPLLAADDPATRKGAPAAHPPEPEMLARLTPPPLASDFVTISKVSQNLHAELMLRRVARLTGSGSIADGQAAVKAMLTTAGVPRWAVDLSDGSGMSSYNRVAPSGVVVLLRWIAAQPWGAQWRATLPVGGVDGTLAKRFHGTALDGKLFAKTGSLNATSALSGYMIAKSGRTLTFSLYANDVPPEASATKAMDTALLLVADAN